MNSWLYIHIWWRSLQCSVIFGSVAGPSPRVKFTPDLIDVACGAFNASADCFLGHDQCSSMGDRQFAKTVVSSLLAFTVSSLAGFCSYMLINRYVAVARPRPRKLHERKRANLFVCFTPQSQSNASFLVLVIVAD